MAFEILQSDLKDNKEWHMIYTCTCIYTFSVSWLIIVGLVQTCPNYKLFLISDAYNIYYHGMVNSTSEYSNYCFFDISLCCLYHIWAQC